MRKITQKNTNLNTIMKTDNITIEDIENSYCALLFSNKSHEYYVIPEKMVYLVNDFIYKKRIKPASFDEWMDALQTPYSSISHWLYKQNTAIWKLILFETEKEFKENYFINKL